MTDNLALAHIADPDTQLSRKEIGLRLLHRVSVRGTGPPRKHPKPSGASQQLSRSDDSDKSPTKTVKSAEVDDEEELKDTAADDKKQQKDNVNNILKTRQEETLISQPSDMQPAPTVKETAKILKDIKEEL